MIKYKLYNDSDIGYEEYEEYILKIEVTKDLEVDFIEEEQKDINKAIKDYKLWY